MARIAGYVPAAFWIDAETELIRQHPETTAAAVYLLSAPMSNMYGYFRCAREFMALHLHMTYPERAIGLLEDFAFCRYDRKTGFVWVHSACRWSFGVPLTPADNRAAAANFYYAHVPANALLPEFYDTNAVFLSLTTPRRGKSGRPSGLTKGVPSERRTQPGEFFRLIYDAYPVHRRGEATEAFGEFLQAVKRLKPGRDWVREIVLPAILQSEMSDAWIKHKNIPTLANWIQNEGWTRLPGNRGRPPKPVPQWKIAAKDFRNRLLARAMSQDVHVINDEDESEDSSGSE